MKPSILVIGGAGVVGPRVCHALAKAGWSPVVLDSLQSGKRDRVDWVPFIEASCLDLDTLTEVLQQAKPAVVIHLAGCLSEEISLDPAKWVLQQMGTTATIIMAMNQSACHRLIWLGSDEIYAPQDRAIVESDELNSTELFAIILQDVERLLRASHLANGLSYVAFRASQIAGGPLYAARRPSHLLGQLYQAIHQQVPVTWWATDTPDGSVVRDLIHVDDVASALVCGVRYLMDGAPSGVFNLGSGQGIGLLTLLGLVEERVSHSIPQECLGELKQGVASRVLDGHLIRQSLQWVPTLGVSTMIDDTWPHDVT